MLSLGWRSRLRPDSALYIALRIWDFVLKAVRCDYICIFKNHSCSVETMLGSGEDWLVSIKIIQVRDSGSLGWAQWQWWWGETVEFERCLEDGIHSPVNLESEEVLSPVELVCLVLSDLTCISLISILSLVHFRSFLFSLMALFCVYHLMCFLKFYK